MKKPLSSRVRTVRQRRNQRRREQRRDASLPRIRRGHVEIMIDKKPVLRLDILLDRSVFGGKFYQDFAKGVTQLMPALGATVSEMQAQQMKIPLDAEFEPEPEIPRGKSKAAVAEQAEHAEGNAKVHERYRVAGIKHCPWCGIDLSQVS